MDSQTYMHSIRANSRVTAVILNYKNFDETIECVRSLLHQDCASLQCVVVDNASPNDSVERLTRALGSEARVTILPVSANGGYASGNNVGARWAMQHHHPTFLLIINPDVRLPDPSAVSELVAFALDHPDAGAISPRITLPGGFVQGPYERPSLLRSCLQYLFPLVWWVNRRRHQKRFRDDLRPQRCFRTIGACMLLRADDFQAVGMFDEGTFLEGEEDILAERLLHRRKCFYHFPLVEAVHYHSRAGNSKYTITSLQYYFRHYRGASKISLQFYEFCARFYEKVYLPHKRHVSNTE